MKKILHWIYIIGYACFQAAYPTLQYRYKRKKKNNRKTKTRRKEERMAEKKKEKEKKKTLQPLLMSDSML